MKFWKWMRTPTIAAGVISCAYAVVMNLPLLFMIAGLYSILAYSIKKGDHLI